MREIKQYVKNKKKRNNVIGLNIGGEIKYYPILSFGYDISYHDSMGHYMPAICQLTINTRASNLIFLLSDINFTKKYDIYIDNIKFYGCYVIDHSIDNDNISKFTISVDYLVIN